MHTCAERFVGWINPDLVSDHCCVATLGMLNWVFSLVQNKFGGSYFEVLCHGFLSLKKKKKYMYIYFQLLPSLSFWRFVYWLRNSEIFLVLGQLKLEILIDIWGILRFSSPVLVFEPKMHVVLLLLCFVVFDIPKIVWNTCVLSLSLAAGNFLI